MTFVTLLMFNLDSRSKLNNAHNWQVVNHRYDNKGEANVVLHRKTLGQICGQITFGKASVTIL